jgi:[protein-PII] uridylyltransferase
MSLVERAAAERELLFEALAEKKGGLAWCHSFTDWADRLVQAIYDEAKDGADVQLALVAAGGYGRREMSPHSDIDISLVSLGEGESAPDHIVKQLFRGLHSVFAEGLRMKVGYSYRVPGDAPGLDGKSRTALIDARLVAGDIECLDRLSNALWADFPTPQFLTQKIAERDEAIRRNNDTPLATEPELKEGAGGLRAFTSANWIRAALGERMARPGTAVNEVVRVRNQLHLISGRANDRLSVERREEIGERFGVPAYLLGAQLAAALEELHREELSARDRICESRFVLAPGVRAWKGEVRFEDTATAGAAALGIAHAVRLGLDVADLPARIKPEAKGSEAILALASDETTLRAMDKCGVLAALLPELTACRYLMPRDGAHTFTVFEHTLRAIRQIDQIPLNTELGEIKSSLRDLGPLYLAILLHDVGKISSERSHSEVGGEMSRAVAERWGLYPQTAVLVEWLIREHLTLARVIRMRDVMNAETAVEFARVVETEEKLKHLTLLTYADVRAVSAEVWTPVQQTFLEELYRRTLALLQAESSDSPDQDAYRSRLKRQLNRSEASQEELDAFVGSLPAHYLFATPPEDVKWHYELSRQAEVEGYAIDIRDHRRASVSDITVCMPDRPGLLSDLLGVIYASDLSLITIRAATMTNDDRQILDMFTVGFGGRPIPPGQRRIVEEALRAVCSGEKSADDYVRARGKDPDRGQELFRWTTRTGRPTIIEVQAPRGRGMAYRMSKHISRQGWNILAARLGQWAGQGAASFYVEHSGGAPVTAEEIERAFSRQKVV